MNEPLRAQIKLLTETEDWMYECMAYEEGQSCCCDEGHENLKKLIKLIRITVTDLQAAMPVERDEVPAASDLFDRAEQLGFVDGNNQAVTQQQAAFKKVLEGLK